MQVCRFEIGQFRPDVIGHKLLAGRETEQIAGHNQGPGCGICPLMQSLRPLVSPVTFMQSNVIERLGEIRAAGGESWLRVLELRAMLLDCRRTSLPPMSR